MFCSKCANQMNDSAAFCSKCGTPTNAGNYNAPAQMPAQNTQYMPPAQNNYVPSVNNNMLHQQAAAKDGKLEKAALIFSIVGVLFCWAPLFGWPLPMVGLGMGISARKKSQSGTALAAIIISSATIFIAIVVMIILAIGG